MKTLFHSLLLVAAAALGLLIGFAWRGRPRSETASHAAPAAPDQQGPRPSARSLKPRAGAPRQASSLAARLERDLSLASGVTRWLHWFDALERAVPADFPCLAKLAQGNPAALRLVASRWVELDPRHLFETLRTLTDSESGSLSSALAAVLFQEWPKRDPAAAIAALDEPDVAGQRDAWRYRVVDAVLDQEAELGLRTLARWHIENYGPRMTGVAKWAAADPRHAAEFALANASGYAAQVTLETIGREWAKTDPSGALEFAITKPGELGSKLAAATLKAWAGRDVSQASDWLAAVEPRTRQRLGPAFVEGWAKRDASAALDWCRENLTGIPLADAVGGVVTGAAERDLGGAARLVTAMDPSPARTEAARAVARKWFPDLSSDQAVKPETIAWLSSLDPDATKRALGEIEWQWATSDPKTMAAFLSTAPSEQVPTGAYSVLAQQMARQNPSETLAWASRLPAAVSLSAGTDAFAEWRRSQPEAATQWLNDLPADDPRRQPFFEAAIRTLAHDPQAAAQFATLTPQERATALRVLETMTLPADRRARLLESLKRR